LPTVENSSRQQPLLVSVNMGYGHLRAAYALADALEVPVQRADEAPLASPAEVRLWRAARAGYEGLSRLSQRRAVGRPLSHLLQKITEIQPRGPHRTSRLPRRTVRFLERRIAHGFGGGLCRHLEATGAPLVTTFYAPALAADLFTSAPVFCVVTDNDVHPVWAPADGTASRIRYLVPAPETAARLASYGVRAENISVTGFPLPRSLADSAEAHLEARLGRLEGRGEPPLVTFAVGGAGAQSERARQLLGAVAGPLRRGEVRLALVAGLRPKLARAFRRWAAAVGVDGAGGSLTIVEAETFAALYERFNDVLGRTDVLWTKPSELSFYAALGLPLILDDPVGDHERANARWVLQAGAGVVRPEASDFGSEILKWLGDGTLASCARSAFARLPRGGAPAISEAVLNPS
jgi:UDP-N-acetylglucosamine:LPS N-acetylglucosamine transferase